MFGEAVTKITSGDSQGFAWWLVSFEAGVIGIVAASAFTHCHAYRPAVLATLCVVTALVMASTDTYNSGRRSAGPRSTYVYGGQSSATYDGVTYYFNKPGSTYTSGSSSDKSRYDCAFAGFLLLSIVNASPWDYRNTPIPEMRAGAAAVRKQLYAKWPNAVEQMRDMVIHQDGLSIPVRVYVPASDQAPLPVCLYFHGGGFVFTDDLEVFDPTAGSLASGGSCIVMSVNYRLAPEHPFPAAVDDCYAALTWVANNAASLGGDPSRLAVAGESAGGNLAAACALLARDRQGPELRLQLLHCPVVDAPEPERPSYQKYGKGYMLTEDLMAWFVELYIQQPDDLVNPNFALLRAASFKGVAPAVIITAEYAA
ncbi:hypothetical protein WJX72_006309 [[Myrmecia] bisecta]|uniref:Alpha/beta hydrolase fold-3 domain-containing protein n=1 Tax=[Myrmecia] bisecta TaxID=41462 RepID=A0AAW1PES7_9CHLO